MRFFIFVTLGVLLIVCSGYFFYESVQFAAERDYAGAIIVATVGYFIISAGRDMARLAFLQRK